MSRQIQAADSVEDEDDSSRPTQGPTSPSEPPNDTTPPPSGASAETGDSDSELGVTDPVLDAEQAREREAPKIPSHAPSTAQDMSAISGVDLLALFFTDLPMVPRVPTEYWQQWARANTIVYDWVLDSEPGSVERDNALFWELIRRTDFTIRHVYGPRFAHICVFCVTIRCNYTSPECNNT